MKATIQVLFLLTGFVAAHAALRILVLKALGAYEMTLPHCRCGAYPSWLLAFFGAFDFFTHWPSPVLSDFLWGGGAVALYLWAEKRRKAKRASARRAKDSSAAEVQAGVWPPPVATSRPF